jgi:hypothetical protein
MKPPWPALPEDAAVMEDPDVLPEVPVVALPDAVLLGAVVAEWAVVAEEPELIEDEPGAAGAGAGCIAGEPVVAEPDAVAAGRSVPPDGEVVFWARAGAATKVVANRQAAMCFFSIVFSWRCRDRGAHRAHVSTPVAGQPFQSKT